MIRLPSSLHGKTGFEVVQVTRDRLKTFDPFAEAVSDAFGDEMTCVVCDEPVEAKLKDERFSLDQGDNMVPEYAAVYLVCRKLAKVKSQT